MGKSKKAAVKKAEVKPVVVAAPQSAETFNITRTDRVVTTSGTRAYKAITIGTLEIDLSSLTPEADAKARKVLGDL